MMTALLLAALSAALLACAMRSRDSEFARPCLFLEAACLAAVAAIKFWLVTR